MVSIPISPAYRTADSLEMELVFGDDSELTFGDALSLVEEEQEDEHGGTAEASGEDDKREGWIREAFRHLRYRAHEFGSSYPLTVEAGHGFERLVRNEEKTQDKLLYCFLLACSHLGKFDKREENKLTSVFEDVCVPVAAAYLNGEAERFGAAGKKGNGHFATKLKNALPQLAEYINAIPNPGNIEKVKDNNTGDAGIDIVARTPFPGNDYFGMLAALGQCTCSDSGWQKKVHEAHYDFINKFLFCNHPTGNLFFIPFFWRSSDGRWDNELELHQSIPFDRLRICRLLSGMVSDELAADIENCLEAKPKLVGYAA